jgi:hypothetical protein
MVMLVESIGRFLNPVDIVFDRAIDAAVGSGKDPATARAFCAARFPCSPDGRAAV